MSRRAAAQVGWPTDGGVPSPRVAATPDDAVGVAEGADVLAIAVWPGDAGEGAGDSTADGVPPAPWLGPEAESVTARWGTDLFTALERERASGRAGEVVTAGGGGADPVVLLVGLGDGGPVAARRAGAALARRCRGRGRVVASLAATLDDAALRALVEGFVLGGYAFSRRSAELAVARRPPGELLLAGVPATRTDAVDRAAAIARASWLARDLGNTPSSEKDPAWFTDRAVEVARTAGLDVRVRAERELAAEGFGGIVAVGMGSVRPPRLVELTYRPRGRARRSAPHVVLVGKGITYDTGGLTIKPREAMVPMKMDMGGAAAVLAAMSALAAVDAPVKVTGLLALAENMPSGTAQRPGDVIRQYGGTTVEVLNPDAEGRLVLADAMAYAVERLAPDAVVDVATLTGAVSLALGKRVAASFATSDALADALSAAGEAAGERLWRLPLVDDYRDALASPVADVANIPTEKVQGGTITAALFLERFAGSVPWAHLDVSGAAKSDGEADEVGRGATGFGTRLLLYWLETREPLAGVGRT